MAGNLLEASKEKSLFIGHRLPWKYWALQNELFAKGEILRKVLYEKIKASPNKLIQFDLQKLDLSVEVPTEHLAVQEVLDRYQTFDQHVPTMGVVNDVTFILCYWPALDYPVKLFDEGSSGIKVLGSARNVIFPEDTVFLDYYPDALYPAELAVKQAHHGMRSLINLTPEQTKVWANAYDAHVLELVKEAETNNWSKRADYDGRPTYHTVESTVSDCCLIKHRELISNEGEKARYAIYVAPLSIEQAKAIAAGEVTVEDATKDSVFVKQQDILSEAENYYKIVDEKATDVTAELEAP